MCFNTSSSGGNTATTSTQTKKDQVIGNGSLGLAADNGAVVNATINQTDGGAVRSALDFASTQSGNAFSFANSMGANALTLASNSLAANNNVTKGAFDLVAKDSAIASDNYGKLLSTTSSALSGILSGINSTQSFISSTQAQAQGAMDNKTKMIVIVAGLAVAGLVLYGATKK